MGISGNLRTMDLSEILLWASQGKTGVLRLENGDVSKGLYFIDGSIVASQSTSPRERLGHFLVARGLISEVEVSKAIEMQEETGMLLGSLLLSIGAVEEDELKGLLVRHCEEILYDLFTWSDGEFCFTDGEQMSRGMIPMTLDVASATMEGLERASQANRLRELIPTVRAIPVAISELGEADDPAADQIFKLIDDSRTIEEICQTTHYSEFVVCRAIATQMEQGRVKVVVPREPPQEPIPEAPRMPDDLRPRSETLVDDLLKLAEQVRKDGEHEQADRYMQAAELLALGSSFQEAAAVPESAAPPSGAAQQDGANRVSPDPKVEAPKQPAEEVSPTPQTSAPAELDLSAVPVLDVDLGKLAELDLTPEEGFLLTRIDGSSSIKAVIGISALPKQKATSLFAGLLEKGRIKLR